MSSYKKPNMEKPPETFDNCPGFLERYLDYIFTFQNRSPSTVIEVCVNLREFFQYIHYCNLIGEKPSTKDAHRDMDISCMQLDELCKVSREQIEEYLCFLDTVCRISVLTVRKKIILLRRFYLYLSDNAHDYGVTLLYGNPAAKIPVPSQKVKPAKILSVQQVQRLADNTTGETALRDRAIILLLATTGITLSELVNLDTDDLENDTLCIRQTKKPSREIYLTPDCHTALQRYLSEREDSAENSAMFLSSSSPRRLTPKTVQRRISRAAMVAGMSQLGICAQALRDFAAATLLNKAKSAINKEQIKAYLGFTSELATIRFTEELRHES